jgi:hypothetical protein
MNTSRKHGGPRKGAGRYRQRLAFSVKDAREIYRLLKHRRGLCSRPDMTEEELIMSLVEREWQEIDQAYQKAAEIAQEPYIF